MSSSAPFSSTSRATPERAAELAENLQEIRNRVQVVAASSCSGGSRPPSSSSIQIGQNSLDSDSSPLLVAVSKYKPASDILACYELGQRDFGENYVQELVDKAKELPQDIRWHFIGTFQTNKAKLLASIPNLYALQTLSSIKGADALNRALLAERGRGRGRGRENDDDGSSESPLLNVLLQVNTSGEDVKSGLPPLAQSPATTTTTENEDESSSPPPLLSVAVHVLEHCPHLHLQGLMTIGSLSESLSASEENRDFKMLVQTRDRLEELLRKRYSISGGDGEGEGEGEGKQKWSEGRRLLLSMGMSSDFEAAIKAGSDIVRVGTGIFGQRHTKEEK